MDSAEGSSNPRGQGHPIKMFSPQHSPFVWLIINLNVLGYSIVLLVFALGAAPQSRFAMFTKASYLYYDFITTIVWTCEAGLKEWSVRTSHRKELCMIRVELAMSIIFAVLTTFSLHDSIIQKNEPSIGVWDVIINILAYTYQVYESYLFLESQPSDAGSLGHNILEESIS